jgi:hypothetical protein
MLLNEKNYILQNKHILKSIEKRFLSIKENGINKTDISLIVQGLRKLFNVEISEFNIVSDKSILIRVFPAREELEGHALKIVETKKYIRLEKATNIVIEIGKNVLFHKNITPEEITAGILHEVGHLFNRDIETFIDKIFSIIYYFLRPILDWLPQIFSIALFVTVLYLKMLEKYIMNHDMKLEIKADSFAVMNGYGDSLASLLDKLVLVEEKRLKDSSNKKFIISEVLKQVVTRKKSILEIIEAELLETTDPYVKKVLTEQVNKLKAYQK